MPDVDKANAFFGGWKIRPSNTYWSGGQFDPWRTLSPLSSESFAPNITLEQDIPDCGATSSSDTIFGYTMQNAEHAFDFRTTFPGGEQSRTFFTNALTKWLKCWKPGVKPESPADILQEGRIGFSQMDSMKAMTVQT